jgi:hypothetical protein
MLNSQSQIEGSVEHVSSKGAFVSCKEVPPLEEGFLMIIRAPEYTIMNLNGKVIWSTVLDSGEGDPLFGVGVQFTRMSADNRQLLHKMIALHYGMKTSRTPPEK